MLSKLYVNYITNRKVKNCLNTLQQTYSKRNEMKVQVNEINP